MKNVDIHGYSFEFICEILPKRTETGEVFTYNPSERYNNKRNLPFNKYGNSLFCEFEVKTDKAESGVYALFFDENLVYIGQAKNFQQRWSGINYCKISPRNCFRGGQSTNCHINSEICKQALRNGRVFLYFLETKDYDRVEKELIKAEQSNSNLLNTQRY